jgi:hypothetical protein
MPYKIVKNRGVDTYKVVNRKTGVIHAKSATKKNAEAQVRLLESLEKKK